jgi:type IV pilus assembly protein PilC
VLLGLAVVVLVFLLTFFIPRFKLVFQSFDAALPLITRIIVQASEYMQQYGLFLLALVIVGVIAAHRWAQSEQGRRFADRALLRVPMFGPLRARFAMTRFCRMFGTLVGAGVPLVNALIVARQSIGSQTLTDTLNTAVESVQRGGGLAASLRACPELFPGPVLEMVSVAEETGRIHEEFIRVADAAEKDLDRRLRTTVALAEPLMLFVIAGIIGVIFIGMVLPIFSLQEHIQ